MPEKRPQDRRIQKTRALLRGALAELIGEKPYEEIVVKEILSRANVGRSTFYTHFGDTDELLLSCIHDVVRSARRAGRGGDPGSPHEDSVFPGARGAVARARVAEIRSWRRDRTSPSEAFGTRRAARVPSLHGFRSKRWLSRAPIEWSGT